MKKYKLDGHAVVPCENTTEWAQWFEHADRRVALDTVDGWTVSTVFLGLDHSFSDDHAPLVFESMVFGPENHPLAYSCERTATWQDAELAHAAMLACVEQERDERPRIVIESAPGDRCGNTQRLKDGSRCPGCRACS